MKNQSQSLPLLVIFKLELISKTKVNKEKTMKAEKKV